MSTTTKSKFTIDVDEVDKIRQWFQRAAQFNYRPPVVAKWCNQDLSNSDRPDLLSPVVDENGNQLGAPHWANCKRELLEASDIDITTRRILDAPRKMFHDCAQCNGTGRRAIQSIADARRESVDSVRNKILIRANGLHKCPAYQTCNECIHCDGFDIASDTVNCTYCNGTGCEHYRRLTGRVKRTWWNATVLVVSQKLIRACRMLERGHSLPLDSVQCHWEFNGINRSSVDVIFYHETIAPFTME